MALSFLSAPGFAKEAHYFGKPEERPLTNSSSLHPFWDLKDTHEETSANQLLTGGAPISSLEAMEQSALTQAKLPIQPWGDYYWPTRKGQIASPYTAGIPDSWDFKDHYEFAKKRTGYAWEQKRYAGSVLTWQIDQMSPAEKYDLLVGDREFTLTQATWGIGKRWDWLPFKVARPWNGICHGWSPAAIYEARPLKKITVSAPDGTLIPFYPEDIKALAGAMWAHGSSEVEFVGERCGLPLVGADDNGHVRNDGCRDVNPATWHMAVVNRIGRDQQGMIMDRDPSKEVWNQPIYSYSYRYFNPYTLQTVGNLTEARVRAGIKGRDLFKDHRSKHAAYLVGIQMEVTFPNDEELPVRRDIDGPEFDALKTITLNYDLELDWNGKIIGGEWYQEDLAATPGSKTPPYHPDFLWVVKTGTDIKSVATGNLVGQWTAGRSVPSSWLKPLRQASKDAQPIPEVVRHLIELSRQPQAPTNP